MAVRQVGQRVAASAIGVGDRGGPDAEPAGQAEEFLTVGPDVRGALRSLRSLEQVVGVVQGGDARQPGSSDGEDRAAPRLG